MVLAIYADELVLGIAQRKEKKRNLPHFVQCNAQKCVSCGALKGTALYQFRERTMAISMHLRGVGWAMDVHFA